MSSQLSLRREALPMRLSPRSSTTVRTSSSVNGRANMLTLSPVIPYVTDEQAIAATKDPQLKLLFRLIKFQILDEGMS